MSLEIDNYFYKYYIHEETIKAPFLLYETFNDIRDDFELCIDIESKIGDEIKYKKTINNEYIQKINNNKIIIISKIISTNINILYNYLYNKIKKLKFYFSNLLISEPYIQNIINNCINHYENIFQQNINFIKENIIDVNNWLQNKLEILQGTNIKPFKKTLSPEEKKEHRKISSKKYYDSLYKEPKNNLTEEEQKEHRKIINAKYYQKLKEKKLKQKINN